MKQRRVKKRNMKVVTRIAPGVSGPLHLGSLYNALLNYVCAKKHNGRVFLRLDAPYKTGPVIRFEREIEETLRLFRLIPDFVIKQSDRRGIYRKQLENILSPPDVYFCQCNNQDITKRFYNGAKGYIIDRHDKYPQLCSIKQIKIYDDRIDITKEAQFTASIIAPGGFEIDNVVSDKGIWKPFNPWYYGNVRPSITLKWRQQVCIDAVQILWLRYPAKTIQIFVDDKQVAESTLKNDYWDEHLNIKSTISFKETTGRKLTIIPIEFLKIIQKEYAYDNYCRDKKLKLQLNNSNTFVRKRCDNFVDVLLWNGEERKVDLAFRSAIDDKEFGVTYKIRGIDINVFMELEKRCAELIDHKYENIKHGLILHPNMYKYAKSTGARDIRYYIEKGLTPDEVLSILAWKTGLIREKKVLTLRELIEKINFPIEIKNTIIDENVFLKGV